MEGPLANMGEMQRRHAGLHFYGGKSKDLGQLGVCISPAMAQRAYAKDAVHEPGLPLASSILRSGEWMERSESGGLRSRLEKAARAGSMDSCLMNADDGCGKGKVRGVEG